MSYASKGGDMPSQSAAVQLSGSLTPEELHKWKNRILRDIRPKLEKSPDAPNDVFTKELCNQFNEFFTSLSQTPFTRDLVRATRINLALDAMIAPGGGWPDIYVKKAETGLEKLEGQVGSLKELHDELWGEGGRLEGCQEVTRADGRKGWVIELKAGQTVEKAFGVGAMGFHPGDWWIGTAAAMRAGIISSLEHFITTDGKLAPAIVIPPDLELAAQEEDQIRLLIDMNEKGSTKILKNSTVEKPIRVLKYVEAQAFDSGASGIHVARGEPFARGDTNLAGIKYEGLYYLDRHTLKLNEFPEEGGEQTVIYLELKRLPGQANSSIPPRPNDKELMDHATYVQVGDDKSKDITEVDTKRDGVVVQWLPERVPAIGKELGGSKELRLEEWKVFT